MEGEAAVAPGESPGAETARPGTRPCSAEGPALAWAKQSNAPEAASAVGNPAQPGCHGQHLPRGQGRAGRHVGDVAVPAQPPPSCASSCFPQVTQRQPQEAPQVTWKTVTPLYMDRLFPRPATSGRSPGLDIQDSLEGGHSLPRSGTVTRPQRLSVSDLPPLHGPPLTVTRLSPKLLRAASAKVKLPPLPAAAAAASGSSPRGRARSGGPMASGHRQLVPPAPWGTMAADRAWETPSQDSSPAAEGLWRGSAARQGLRLPSVQSAHKVQIRTGTQPAWKHLGHSETEELIKVQEGHDGNTCSDLFRDLAPYLRENRSVRSTSSTPKWLSARQGAQGTRRPAEQTARRKQLCPEDEDALMQLLRKKTQQLEELEDKVYEERFRAIFSSLDNNESRVTSSCVRRDPSSPTLEPAAGPSVLHSTCSVTKDAAGETESSSELVSLDQLLADLCPVSHDSLSCDALIRELLEECEEEQLPDREEAGERDSEPESALSLPRQDEEAETPVPALDSDPCDEGRSEPLPTALPQEPELFAVCASPADPADEADAAGREAGRAQATPPQAKPCRAGEPAGACPVPAQPLARSGPSPPAGTATVPRPPAPRRWRSVVKTARRALRRLFSFSCLRRQLEE